ncbi:TPA: HP1 family phage holin [Vibrio vulnificus]
MLESKKLWISALAGVVIAFLIAKSDKITQFFGGLTAAMGMMGLDRIALLVGILFTVLSYITSTFLNWHFKNKRHRLLESKLATSESIASILDSED